MDKENTLTVIRKKCKFFLGKELISDDGLLRKYLQFLSDNLFSENRNVLFTLHTGSKCFDAIAVILFGLECITHEISFTGDDTEPVFREGDIVVYKNKRYKWCGEETNCSAEGTSETYFVLKQDAKGKNGPQKTYVPADMKNAIKPYYGTSSRTDGMGLRFGRNNREDFLSFILSIPQNRIPAIANDSIMIVGNKDYVSDLIKNVQIQYNGKSVNLTDLFPSSYYTASGEEIQIGSNPLKAGPVLRVCGDITTAREMILDRDNNVRNLLVLEATSRTVENGELDDLLSRHTLRHKNVSGIISSDLGEYALKRKEADSTRIFACTKEYIRKIGIPYESEKNSMIDILHTQENNIVYSNISCEDIDGGWTWKQYEDLHGALEILRNSSWNEGAKNLFLMNAYAMINLLNSALFSMEYMESSIRSGRVGSGIESPTSRIQKLKELSNAAGSYKNLCDEVIKRIEQQYCQEYSISPKFNAIRQYVNDYYTRDSDVVLVVPKAYYVDLLKSYMRISTSIHVNVVTANRLNPDKYYDGLLIACNFNRKTFDPLNCKTAAETVVFLYENERKVFRFKVNKISRIDYQLNAIMGIAEPCKQEDTDINSNLEKKINAIEEADNFIDNMPIVDFSMLPQSYKESGFGQTSADIVATGKFLTGETILFTKYYTATVVDKESGTVREKEPKDLEPGDVLIFMLHDSYTKNTVDSIFDYLLSEGKFPDFVVDAKKKVKYWKDILRHYKEYNDLTYLELARGLKRYGSSVQAVAVRQWLADDGHVVGPRKEETMESIAKLTRDDNMCKKTKDYYEACRIIRKERKEILKMIGAAIEKKNIRTDNGEILKEIQKNIDRISCELELERMNFLKDPVSVPINLSNKPLEEGIFYDK